MKKLVIILAVSALMVPAAAQAGHNCAGTATMRVNCEQGVKVYRTKPLKYAPGQLKAMVQADRAKAKQHRLEKKLAMKSRKLKSQRKEIAKLEKRLEKLESRNNRRANSGQFITGVGLGAGFLSPQRVPGFNNGLISGSGNYGGHGRRH